MYSGDTIVALSTPPGRGGLGIVRLSGRDSRSIAKKILRLPPSFEWRTWRAHFAHLVDEAGISLDQVVATFFAGPRSYTGEDVVEISCHGAPVVLRFCVERAMESGARLAEPGEFTFRAYIRGRIDLPRAEAVRDLIEATTLYQARVAAQQMDGSVSRRIQPVKDQLLELIALLEAGIDFAEDDISVATAEDILQRLRPVQEQLHKLAGSFEAGKLVFQGFTLAIAGRPNVGKSSLFNRLLEQDRAIVTALPGTTRDTVAESFSLDGLPVRLVDTAGIRRAAELVENLGIERSFQAIADADLTLLVLDQSSPLEEEDRALLTRLAPRNPFIIGNKADLAREMIGIDFLPVSAVTGLGILQLKEAIVNRLAPNGLVMPEDGSITNIRQAALVRESLAALGNAERAVEFGIPHEMVLIDLYAALGPIDAATGATTVDDILNRIFSTFCIGK